MENLKELVEAENNRLKTEKFLYVPKKDVPKGARCGCTAAAMDVETGELFNIKQFTKEVLKKEYQPTKTKTKTTALKKAVNLLGEGFTVETIAQNKENLMELLIPEENGIKILQDLKAVALQNEEKSASLKKREQEIAAFFDSL